MHQQSYIGNSRFSPLAVGVVLLIVLAALAVRAHAEENASTSPREQLRILKEERAEVYTQNKEERAALLRDQKIERESWRASSTDGRAVLFQENKDERRALFAENKTERETWRASSTHAMREAFDARREEVKAGIEARREEFKQKHSNLKARFASTTQERLGAHVRRMTERMNKIVDHLSEIADRIESRIEKIEEVKDIELADARENLNTARSLIDTAREDIADLGNLAEEALGSDDPKTRMEDVRTAAKLARDSIGAVHGALQQTVEAIKASSGDKDDESAEEDSSDKEHASSSETDTATTTE